MKETREQFTGDHLEAACYEKLVSVFLSCHMEQPTQTAVRESSPHDACNDAALPARTPPSLNLHAGCRLFGAIAREIRMIFSSAPHFFGKEHFFFSHFTSTRFLEELAVRQNALEKCARFICATHNHSIYLQKTKFGSC